MSRFKIAPFALSVTMVGQLACSGSDDSAPATAGTSGTAGEAASGGNGGSGNGGTGNGGTTSGGKGGGNSGGDSGSSGSSGSSGAQNTGGSSSGSGGSGATGGGGNPPSPARCEGEVATALPALPELGVSAVVIGNRARIRVDPVAGAADYRIYALPADGDVEASGNSLVVRNATYRCGGATVAQNSEPVLDIEWPTVVAGQPIVVEALDAGCPFTGHLAFQSAPAGEFSQPFLTPDEARDTATGELFINGQFEPESRPQPIARGFACIEPTPVETMDYFEDFSNFAEELSVVRTEDHSYEDVYLQTDSFDISFQFLEPDAWSFGVVDDQLWVAYADWVADVPGKFRATLRRSAPLSDTTFVHATMAVDAISTHRRYPQLWLSTAPVPVQTNMEQGVTINLENFNGVPNELLLLQICENRSWDVNEQCPIYYDPANEDAAAPIEFEERTAIALPVRYDLYLSTRRAYVFYDSVPILCAEMPEGAFNVGDEVRMTVGDVLYHSGADEAFWDDPGPSVYEFHTQYQSTETRRVFDDFGFSEGVPEPAWDEQAIPCFENAYLD